MADECCAHNHKHEDTSRHENVPPVKSEIKGSRTFRISGMDCAEEVAVLKTEVGPVVGGENNLAFDILNGRMIVNNAAVAEEDIVKAVKRTGMTAHPIAARAKAGYEDPEAGQRNYRKVMTIISGLLLAGGVAFHAYQDGNILSGFGYHESDDHALPLVSMILYGLSALTGAWFVLPKAWIALKRFRPDMNLLMTVAVLGAIGINEWFEGATVAFLFALSLMLESWSVGRARRAVQALMALTPDMARIRHADGKEENIQAEKVEVDSTVIVMAGERIPLDGLVSRGESHVNQAPITGESVPVLKQANDTVYAGTINGDGTLEIKITKSSEDTTLAGIIRLIQQAQSQRAPSEQWVEKFARIYTPAVMLVAFAVFIVPPLLLGFSWGDSFYRTLTLLVIACPCALVISTPVSIVASLAASARAGVLVKGGLHMETPGKLKAIAVDKTGTLTMGKPAVVDIIPLSGHTIEELLVRAAALEARSSHPLATAILAHAEQQNVTVQAADDVQIIPGKGVIGTFDGRLFWLGSDRYMQERKQETADIRTQLNKLRKSGRTVIVIGNESHVCGLIAVADAIRPQAKTVIQELKDVGIEHVVMLSGDNRATAESSGREVGITEIEAELLPEDKVTAIDALVKKYGIVAMVGDGVNDAPAMARSSLGVAMGAIGSDAAIESADVALMSDDLSKLAWLIKHSRRTLSIIKQNIILSLATKSVFLVLTMLGHSSLWAAIAADMGTTLVVIANALRLLRTSKDQQLVKE